MQLEFFFVIQAEFFFSNGNLFFDCVISTKGGQLYSLYQRKVNKTINQKQTNYLHHFLVSFGKYFAALTLFMNSSISTLCSLEIHFSSFYFAHVQPNHFCFTMKNVSFTFISRLFMVYSIPKIKGFNLKHNICRCICSLTQIFGIDSMHLNISRTFICSPILFLQQL